MTLRSIPPVTIATRRSRPAENGGQRRGGAGRYLKPKAQTTRRGLDVVVPPRRCLSPVHKIVRQNGDYLVRLDFPERVSETDVVWRLSGDILEIEYVGGQSNYYCNFLVPLDCTPDIEFGPFAFAARFRKERQAKPRS
jgi:hypothetical protein